MIAMSALRIALILTLIAPFNPISFGIEDQDNPEIKMLRSFDLGTRIVYSASLSPDGKLIAIAGEDLRIFEIESGHLLWKIEGHEKSVQAVAFSPDQKLIVTGGGDSAVRVWESDTGQLLKEMWGHGGRYSAYVRCVAFSPDGETVASGGDDATVRVWDVVSGMGTGVYSGHEAMVRCVAFSPDGLTILSGSALGVTLYWDMESHRLIHAFNPILLDTLELAFSPDGIHALSCYVDGPVIQWDLERKREVNRFGLKGNPWFVGKSLSIDHVAYSPNGGFALFGFNFNGSVILWDVDHWREVTRFQASNDLVEYVDFVPGSNLGVTVACDEEVDETYRVTLWELPSTAEDLNDPLETSPNPTSAVTPYPEMVIEFPDKNLEAIVREAIGKIEGPIAYSDVQEIEILSATGQNIEDIGPLRYFQNLKVLNLSHNRIDDLQPIGDLLGLEKLILSSNQVSRLSPLTELNNLRYLNLANNKIEDVGPLSTLGSIEILILDGNKVEEVDALYAILSKGDFVSLKDNPLGFIARIGRLRGLKTAGVTVKR